MAPWNLDGLHTGLVIAYVIDDRIRTHPKIPLDHADCQVEAFFIILFYFIFNTRL